MRETAVIALVGAAATATHIDPTSLFLILGAIVFAAASWRRDTRNVLRQQNLDLAERNQTLEADLKRSKALIDSLNQRPNLDQQAQVLAEVSAMLQGVSENVIANTKALNYWLAEKQQDDLDRRP